MNEDMYNKICSVLPSLDIDFDNGIITTPRGGHGTIDSGRYLVFKNNKIKFQLHQVLAVHHFGKECIGMTVNHKNGDKLDNSKDNLELLSLSENVKHQHRNGLAVYPTNKVSPNRRKILSVNLITGEEIIHDSLEIAMNYFNINSTSSIYNVLKGIRKEINNICFKYYV